MRKIKTVRRNKPVMLFKSKLIVLLYCSAEIPLISKVTSFQSGPVQTQRLSYGNQTRERRMARGPQGENRERVRERQREKQLERQRDRERERDRDFCL